MDKLSLNKISISQFLGRHQIDIPIKDNVLILIGENGLGKTQVLNIIYFLLSRKFEKLLNFSFKEIKIEFEDGEGETISKSELEFVLIKDQHPILGEIIEKIGIEKFSSVRTGILFGKFDRLEFAKTSEGKEIAELVPLDFFYDLIRRSKLTKTKNYEGTLFENRISNMRAILIRRLKDYQILYFPTFRRVEEDLRNLGYSDDQFKLSKDDNTLIHFGMDDVQKRFEQYTQRIDKLSKEGFSKLSSEILSQLIKGIPEKNIEFINNINSKDVQIILERIGSQMSEEDKYKIIDMINTKEVLEKDDFLLYFLEKLIDIYDQQREFDTSIKEFVKVCNEYLFNKKVVYDESNLKIYIKSDEFEGTLLLSKLSSGEKQMISILSKIYLSPKEHSYIVLFDEPELSLSIFWQKRLLPDIINSKKCAFLMAVTHSPFIFDNDLDKYAIAMREFFILK